MTQNWRAFPKFKLYTFPCNFAKFPCPGEFVRYDWNFFLMSAFSSSNLALISEPLVQSVWITSYWKAVLFSNTTRFTTFHDILLLTSVFFHYFRKDASCVIIWPIQPRLMFLIYLLLTMNGSLVRRSLKKLKNE